MKTGEPAHRVPWLALTAGALSWLLSSAPAHLQTSWALTQAGWKAEPWRLWTGHFVHFGAAHLRGDLIAFVVWAALIEQQDRRTLARILLLATPLLSVALLAAYPSLSEYRGLSGLDCSLVVALIGQRGFSSARFRWLGPACLAAFAFKCVYEATQGRALLAPDLGGGARLLPMAHVLGAVLGAGLQAWALAGLSRCRSPALLPVVASLLPCQRACLASKPSSVPNKTRPRARAAPPKPASSCARKCTIFARASTARAAPNKPSRSGSPKLAAPGST